MDKPHRLKTYLLAFALVLTIPLLFGTALAVRRFSDAERLHLMSMATDAGEDIAIRVDREIATRAAILQGLSATPSIEDDLDLFSEQARRIAATTGIQIVLFDTTGQQLVNTRVAPGEPLPTTSDPHLIREVVERQTMIYVANLFVGKITQSEQVQVAVPVMRDGTVYRILGASILSQRLVSLVSEDLMGALSATLLDRDGIVIAQSRDSGARIGSSFPGFVGTFSEEEGTVWLPGAERGLLFAYYRRLPMSGWVVISSIPKTALDGPLLRSLESLAALIVALASLGFGSAWLIARRLTDAHRSLIEAAAAVGDGCVPSPRTTALSEVNHAAAALEAASRSVNDHAERLMDANQNLEARVRERTEALVLQTAEIESKTALLTTTLDTMKEGLMVVDAEGHVPICNLQARRLLELPDAVLDRRPSFEDIAARPAGQDRTQEAAEPIRLPDPRHADPVVEIVGPRGRILLIRTAAIQRGGGFVQTVSDVTEERRNRRLLEEARIAAETANSAKTDFLANMSHEMRTPLNAILGYSDLILGKPGLESDLRRSVERVREAGAALLGLTNDVLDLGKIEAGVIDIRFEPFALPDLVDQTVSIIRPIAETKRLALHTPAFVPMEGLRLGDRDRLRQVLLNLLGNAVKFTPAGEVSLSVRPDRDHLRFEVADTGIGIAEDDRGKLFQRFQPLDLTIDRRFGGAGLGLAISKHLVERMGGTIGFESVVGKGSLFWFDLPLPAWQSGETGAGETGAGFARHPVGKPARILVAEDVAVNQELARELLQAAGYDVHVVSTGKAALEALGAGTYDLVLMDLSMPEMDGLTATRHVRSGVSGRRETPIIACTAHVLPSRIEAMMEAGVDAILFKPFRRAELYGTIDRALGQAGRGFPAERGGDASDTAADLVALIGPDAVTAALGVLRKDLAILEAAAPSSRQEVVELADRAHAMIATASLLDWTELAEGARQLEEACRLDRDIEVTLRQFRRLVSASRKEGGESLVRA